MDTATDVLPGNALPWEVSNLIVIVFIILLVLWAVRLCRVGLHLQDLRAGVNSDQILQVDGLGPFMPIVSVLEKQHLTQFLRTHRAAPAQTVPQLQQPFEVERVDIANSVDTAGLQLPAGVKVSLTAEVPCYVQAFWGVHVHYVAALERGVVSLPVELSVEQLHGSDGDSGDASSDDERGIGEDEGQRPAEVGGQRAGRSGRSYTHLRTPSSDGTGAGDGGNDGAGDIELGRMQRSSTDDVSTPEGDLFPASAVLARSEPDTVGPGTSSVTLRMPPSIRGLPRTELLSERQLSPAAVLGAHSGRVPIVIVVGRCTSGAAATTSSSTTAGAGAGVGAFITPTGSGGVDRSIVAGSRGVQLTASVVALSWPTPPKQQARRTPARAPGTPGTVPTEEDGHDSDGGADAAAAADSAASGTTSPTTPHGASSPPSSPKQGQGAGAGGGAGGGAGVGAQSPATAASQEPKVVIMHHVAVTRSAGYVVEEVYGGDESDDECDVCFSEKKCVVFLPCRHLSVCESCFTKMNDVCPVCRTKHDSHIVLHHRD